MLLVYNNKLINSPYLCLSSIVKLNRHKNTQTNKQTNKQANEQKSINVVYKNRTTRDNGSDKINKHKHMCEMNRKNNYLF